MKKVEVYVEDVDHYTFRLNTIEKGVTMANVLRQLIKQFNQTCPNNNIHIARYQETFSIKQADNVIDLQSRRP